MHKTNLNKVEEECIDHDEIIESGCKEDGANLSPLHVTSIMGNKSKMIALLKEHKDDIDKGDKIGRTPLMYSILGDRYDCAEALLKAGADVNRTDVDERAALHWAAYQGNHKFVKLLLDRGAKQDCQDKEGRTPLHLSLSHDNIRVMAKLLKDADIDCRDGNGMTPLHFSVAYERPEHTKMLLHANASPDCQDNDKKTVLHWAKTNKEITIVQRLLDYERVMLILNTKDSDGRTALHLAVAADNKRLVRYLTSRADCLLSVLDHMQRTPLHWAAILGHTELVEVLLARGSDPLIPDKNGMRPLHYAAQNNFGKTVHAMLEHDNVRDVADNDSRTALMWSAAKGAYDALSVLISHKQDFLAADKGGATALHMAAEGGHLQCVTLLLQNQASVNALDKQQYTPLFCACQMGHKEVVEALLLYGASVDLEDKEGRTPLHWAAVGGRTDICAMLLDHGLDSAKQDKLGRPALHYAAYSGFYTTMSLLLEFRADVDARDNSGVTALHWACASGSLDAVKLLFRYNSFPNFVETEGDKLTPLDYAIIREHQDVAQFMMEHGAFTIAGIQDVAATVIQATWRGYRLRQSFQEQKDLLLLHEQKRKQSKRRPDSYSYKGTSSVYTTKDSHLTSNAESGTEFHSSVTTDEIGEQTTPNEKNHIDTESSAFAVCNDSKGKDTTLLPNNMLRKHSHDMEFYNELFGENLSYRLEGFEENNTLHTFDRKTDKQIEAYQRSTAGETSRNSLFTDDLEKHNQLISGGNKLSFEERFSKMALDEAIDHTSNTDSERGKSQTNKSPSNGNLLFRDDKKSSGYTEIGKAQADDITATNNEKIATWVSTSIIKADGSDFQDSGSEMTPRSDSCNSHTSIQRDGSIVNLSGSRSESDGPPQPWQIFKRGRQRANLIRKKIESAVVIQRAFRRYLQRTTPCKSEETSQHGDESQHSQDDTVIKEIAALVVQLNWRQYVKRKLLKQRIEEETKEERDHMRLSETCEEKPQIVPRSQNLPLQKRKAKSNYKTKRLNADFTAFQSIQTMGNNNERAVTTKHKSRQEKNLDSVNHEHLPDIHRKIRPRTVTTTTYRENNTNRPSVTTQMKSVRQKDFSSKGRQNAPDLQPSGFKMHMPNSWSSNLQKYPLR